MMDTTWIDKISVTGASPDSDLCPSDDCLLPVSPEQPHPKLSLRHELKLALIGAAAGILTHALYLFIMAMLPVQSSGAARLGERFADFF
jgi:hypothetical protein